MEDFEVFNIITLIIFSIVLVSISYFLITNIIKLIKCNKELKRLDIELEQILKELSNCFDIGEKNKSKTNNDIVIIEDKYIKDKKLYIVYRYENGDPRILYTRNVFNFLSWFE